MPGKRNRKPRKGIIRQQTSYFIHMQFFFFFSGDAIEGNGLAPVPLDLAGNGKILKGNLF